MPVEKPYPSIEQYWTMAPKASGRISVGMRELKRRLEGTMLEGSGRDLITHANTQLGYTTDDVKIRHPKFIAGAPTGDENGLVNGILMSVSTVTDFQGNAQFKNEYSVSIYSIDERIETEEQYWRHLDRLELIRVALFPFLNGCIDAQGRVCWSQLVPTQAGVEVEDWDIYGGLYLFYRMVCGPSQNTWSTGV